MQSEVAGEIAGLEPSYSAREAAAVLNRSYSWLDQRLRRGELVRSDGSGVGPLRSPGGYDTSRSPCSATSRDAAIATAGTRSTN